MRFFAMWSLSAVWRLVKVLFWSAVLVFVAYCVVPESWLPLVFAAVGGFVLAMVLVVKAVSKPRAERGEYR
jgi:hypothetical protein